MYKAIGFLSGAMFVAVSLATGDWKLNYFGDLFFIMAGGGAGVTVGAIADALTETGYV